VIYLDKSNQFCCLPDVISFVTIFKGLSKAGPPEAGEKCLGLLREFDQTATDLGHQNKLVKL
jgi:hypothetical protein